MNNFERLLEKKGWLGKIGDSVADHVKSLSPIGFHKEKARVAINKSKKWDSKVKIKQAKDKIKQSKAALRTEARLTHKELQDLGVAGAEKKPDGSNVHRYGKNYLIGYYKKKIEDAKRDGDKFALKLAKDSIKSIEAAEGRLGKGRITIEPTPKGS